MVEVFTFCNNCYKMILQNKYKIRETKKGKQVPIFRCPHCGGSYTGYVKNLREVKKLIKVFVVCGYCKTLWKTRNYKRQPTDWMQCPHCLRRNQFMYLKGNFDKCVNVDAWDVWNKILEKYPDMKDNVYFALKNQYEL